MKLQIILLIFLNFTYCNGFGQDTLTNINNTRWIKDFEKIESKNAKLTAIQQKIFDDRIYNIALKRPCFIIGDRLKSDLSKEKHYYECKILFILNLFDKSIVLNAATNEKILLACREIREQNIDSIILLNFLQGLALYGSDGRCGVVMLKSKSRKLKRRLKELKLYH